VLGFYDQNHQAAYLTDRAQMSAAKGDYATVHSQLAGSALILNRSYSPARPKSTRLRIPALVEAMRR